VRQIHETYGETGQVRLEFKQFPFLSESSTLAAEASLCANDQGQFWPYHDMLFANRGAFSQSNLESYAKELALDEDKFRLCLENGDHSQEVQDEVAVGRSKGVSTTPTLYINGVEVVGAQPYENFETIIEQELTITGGG
jgi:protein-disulfide isomerase